jgi:UDP-GlcNAc:undecaprenyl-phosphate GlcNAc-1-phosphate transferase
MLAELYPWAELPSAVRYTASFAIPCAAALVLTPAAARIARRLGAMDAPGGHKTHAQAVPYLGGVAVALGMLLVGAFAAGANGKLLTVVVGALVLAAIGLLDDAAPVSPAVRLGYQAVAGLALWLVGIRAGALDTPWVDVPVTVVWAIAVTNAVNLLDNMDGLAAAVVAVASLGMAAIAGANGDLLVASFALAIAGASVGFLRWNAPPARIYLGDAGSMLLGFLLASLGLMLDLPARPVVARGLAAVLLVAVPLFDLTLVVVARLRARTPIWQGGADHSSHRLRSRGLSPVGVVVGAALVQAICSIAGLAVYGASVATVLVAGGIVAGLWLAGLRWLLPTPDPAPTPGGGTRTTPR